MGVLSTEVAPQQVLVMEQEIKALLEKGAIEYVPHSNRETGFYSRYLIVPKKNWGLPPILDLRVLNDSVMQLKFKVLTLRQIVSQIRSEDWFVTIDLKDAYFHISLLSCQMKFLRLKKLGLWLNAKKSVLSPLQRTTFLGVIWDSTSMQERLSPGTYRFHPVGCGKNKARPVTHCQTVSETGRSYGSSIQHDTFWTVAHETPAVVVQDQRVFPEESSELWKLWAWPLRGPSS